MKKIYWILLLSLSLLLNIIFAYLIHSYSFKQRNIILKSDKGKMLNLKHSLCKISIILQLYHQEQCCFGVSEAFIKEIKSIGGNDICVFFTLPKNSARHINFIKRLYKLDELYIDDNNIFILREGGFLPTINIVNKNGEILFHSPLPKNVRAEKSLIGTINEIISLL